MNPAGRGPTIRLDRDKAAEAAPENEDWRESQEAAEYEKRDLRPAHALAAEGQNVAPVRIGRQMGVGEAGTPSAPISRRFERSLRNSEPRCPSVNSEATPGAASTTPESRLQFVATRTIRDLGASRRPRGL